jgi:hypothetical protein
MFTMQRSFAGRSLVIAFSLALIVIQTNRLALAESLSGTYRIHFEQTSKSCGPTIPPLETEVVLQFSNNRMRVKAAPGFLGVDVLEADFDRQRNEIRTHMTKRVNLGPTQAKLTLDLKGRVNEKGKKPEIQFETSFDKTADDPAWNCKVRGKGWARKL